MPEKLFGLPAHPLFVHAPIVLIPISALVMLWLAIRPHHVSHFGIPLVGLSFVALVSTVLATQSGEGLEHILNEPSKALEEHAQMGERVRLIAFVFFLLAVAFYVIGRKWLASAHTNGSTGVKAERPKALMLIGVAAALVGILAVGATVYTGHTGATLAWKDAGKPES